MGRGLFKKLYCAGLWFVGGILPLATIGFAPIDERDFASLWLGGKGVLSGINIYDADAYRSFGHALLGTTYAYDFPYPPHALFLVLPFALLPLNEAFWAWQIFSAAIFFWAARPYMPKGLPALLAILTPAALINAKFGQTGLVSASLFLFTFRGIGLAAAALTFKPHVGFLVVPYLLGNRKTLASALVGTAVFVIASAILFGGWEAFLRHVREFQGASLVDGSPVPWLIMGTTPMFGYGVWGWLLFAVVGLFLLARRYNVFTAATATFLISPYGFHYDMAVVCLGFGILLFTCWEGMPPWHRAVASLAFLSPAVVTFGTWLVPPILLLGLLVQTEWLEGHYLRVSKTGDRRLGFRLEVVGGPLGAVARKTNSPAMGR